VERSGGKLRLIFQLDGDEEVHDIADIPAHLENETINFQLTSDFEISFGDLLKMQLKGNQ